MFCLNILTQTSEIKQQKQCCTFTYVTGQTLDSFSINVWLVQLLIGIVG